MKPLYLLVGLSALLGVAYAAAPAMSSDAPPVAEQPRIPYPSQSEIYPSLQKLLDRARLNVTRMLGRASESVFEGAGKFNRALLTDTELDPVLRETVILRVGYISHAKYELQQHEAAARLLNMTDAQMAALKSGDSHSKDLSAQQQAIVDFTDDVVKNVRASDKTLAGVRQFLDDKTVADLILLIGCYMTVSRYLETLGVPLEPKPMDWNSVNKSMKEHKMD